MKTSFLLICALARILSGNQGGQGACKFRGFLKLVNKSGQVQCRCLRLRLGRPGTSEIRIGVEGTLKFLSVDFSVFVQNMCVHLRDHINLSVSGIALRCFQVTMVELQFVSRAGMTKRVKHHIGQPGLFLQDGELLLNDPCLARAAIGQRHNKVKVLVFIPRNSFSSFCAFLQSRRI